MNNLIAPYKNLPILEKTLKDTEQSEVGLESTHRNNQTEVSPSLETLDPKDLYKYIELHKQAFTDLYFCILEEYYPQAQAKTESLYQKIDTLSEQIEALQQTSTQNGQSDDLEKLSILQNKVDSYLRSDEINNLSNQRDNIKFEIEGYEHLEKVHFDMVNTVGKDIDATILFSNFYRIFLGVDLLTLRSDTVTVLKEPIPIPPELNNHILIPDKNGNTIKNITTLEVLLNVIDSLSIDILLEDPNNEPMFDKIVVPNNLSPIHNKNSGYFFASFDVKDISQESIESLTLEENRLFKMSQIKFPYHDHTTADLYKNDSTKNKKNEKEVQLITESLYKFMKILHEKLWLKEKIRRADKQYQDSIADEPLQNRQKKGRVYQKNKANMIAGFAKDWKESESPWLAKKIEEDENEITLINNEKNFDETEIMRTEANYLNLPTIDLENIQLFEAKESHSAKNVLSAISTYVDPATENMTRKLILGGAISRKNLELIYKLANKLPTLRADNINHQIHELFISGELISSDVAIIKSRLIHNRVYTDAIKINMNGGHRLLICAKDGKPTISLLHAKDYHA